MHQIERRRSLGHVAVLVGMLAAMVLVESFALSAGLLGVVLIALVAALALVVIATGADLAKIGLAATLVSGFTLTWNGWYVGPVRVGDVLPFVGLIAFAVTVPALTFRTVPWWIRQLVVGLLLLLLITVLFPTSQQYLTSRLMLDAGGQPILASTAHFVRDNVAIVAKFVAAILVVPLAFAAAARVDRRMVRRLAIAFCLGTALSGLVAFVDHTGVASVARVLTGLDNDSDRTAGFTTQPNFLAETLVLAAPFACWLLTSRIRWERYAGAGALLSLILGVYASGSRGGTACIVLSVVLAFVLLPRTRPHTPVILLSGFAALGVVAVVFPSFGLSVLRETRIYGSNTTEGSDRVRDMVADQGIRDFFYSPIKGIGMQASTDASQVYIQQLAAGGLLLFLLMTLYLLGAIWSSFRMISRTPIAAAICAAALSKIALNVFEASLTDRLYYVQEAILVALLAVGSRHPDPDTDDEFDPSYVPATADDSGPSATPLSPNRIIREVPS